MKRGQQPRRAFNGVALHFCPTEQTGERTSAGEDLDEVEGEEILLFHAFDKFCVGTHSFRYKNATTFLTFQSAGLGKRQRQEESDDDEEMNLLFKPFKRLRIESKESHQERERQQTTKQHNAQHTTTHGTCKHHQCNHPFCAQKSHRNKISQNTEVGPPNHLRQQFPGRKYFIVKSRGGGGSNFPRKQTLADFLSSSSSSPSSNHPSSSSFSSSLAMVSSQQKFPAQFVIFSPGVEIPPLYVYFFSPPGAACRNFWNSIFFLDPASASLPIPLPPLFSCSFFP